MLEGSPVSLSGVVYAASLGQAKVARAGLGVRPVEGDEGASELS